MGRTRRRATNEKNKEFSQEPITGLLISVDLYEMGAASIITKKKRNFVERVHTVENNILSDHGPFSSKMVHTVAAPGSKEHNENMEHVAQVVDCIGEGVFNKEPMKCFRGVGSEENYIFRDENKLKSFRALSEERKLKDQTSYKPVQCEKLTYLEKVWCVKTNFQGTYGEDYKMLTSSRTAYKDSYSISVFRKDECW